MLDVNNNPLWCERYRPRRVADCILPQNLKNVFLDFVEKQMVPNITLSGDPGVGKTTVAKALLEELGCDYIVINGSMDGNIDTLRTTIKDFASSVSLMGGRKYVILDESDYLNPSSMQPALRNFMEQYSKNCGFILTCNYPGKIIEALKSRCPIIEFKIDKNESAKLAAAFFKRVLSILDNENITYDKAVIAEFINNSFPDWRRALNELQKNVVDNKIEFSNVKTLEEEKFAELIGYLKDKSHTNVRKWCGENSDIDPTAFFRLFYDNAYKFIKSGDVPLVVVHIGEYQYKSAFVKDQEINMAAFLVNVMVDVEFK